MRYLLDTNICIHLIRRTPESLVSRFERLPHGAAVLSALVLAELRHGGERDRPTRAQAFDALNGLLRFFPVLPFDEVAAASYGVLRAALPDRRRDAIDRLIAAHAISRGLVLVTSNEANFRDYPGLVIENWVGPA